MENQAEKYRIGKVYITATWPEDADRRIIVLAKQFKPSYVCVSNMRTVAIANQDSAYCKVMNQAAMCLPDGMPLVWMARLWGLKQVQRTVGPDLFMRMIEQSQCGLNHFLLGDTEETLSTMKTKFSKQGASRIVGPYSPPFCELENYNYAEIADQINRSGAEVVWLSLRAPKQDLFAVRLLPYLERGVCVGVGAAFRFSLGEIKHPPKWVQKLGLTGLFWRKFNMAEAWWYVKHVIFLSRYTIDIMCARCKTFVRLSTHIYRDASK